MLIVSVACGAAHSGFITHEGHVFMFGANTEGQLGIDERSVSQSTAPLLVSSLLQQGIMPTKIACGSHHTMVLSEEQSKVFSWGRNAQG